MLRCLAAIFSAVVSLATLGCFHHVGQVVVEPGSTESALSHPEVQAAVAAIAPAVAKLGFVLDPRLDEIARDSRESKEIDNVVVGLFSIDPNAGRDEWIEVRAVVEKGTGKFVVMVTDFGSPRGTKFTSEVEQAVADSLREEFPHREVRIASKTTGPNLGP